MADQNFTKAARVSLAHLQQTSAGTTVNSSWVDTAGYDGVTFFRRFSVGTGTGSTSNSLTLQGATATGGTAAAMTGAVANVNSASQVAVVEVHRPVHRYVRAQSARGKANSALGDCYAIRWLARDKPVTNTVTGAAGVVVTLVQSPATG